MDELVKEINAHPPYKALVHCYGKLSEVHTIMVKTNDDLSAAWWIITSFNGLQRMPADSCRPAQF